MTNVPCMFPVSFNPCSIQKKVCPDMPHCNHFVFADTPTLKHSQPFSVKKVQDASRVPFKDPIGQSWNPSRTLQEPRHPDPHQVVWRLVSGLLTAWDTMLSATGFSRCLSVRVRCCLGTFDRSQ